MSYESAHPFEIPPVGRHGWCAHHVHAQPMSTGPLHDLLRVLGVDTPGTPDEGALALPLLRVRSGSALVLEGAPVEALYIVRSGTLKCYRVLEDGYEQVIGFAAQGDVIGYDGLCSGEHPTGVVALEDSTVYSLPVRELDGMRRRCAALDHGLQVASSRQLANASAAIEMMAAASAEVRLARFLVWLSAWMARRGQSPRRMLLRMGRRDIASLLGVAHETVSRSFGALAAIGCVSVLNREVEILDDAKLHACAARTRGLPDEAPAPSQGVRGRVPVRMRNGANARASTIHLCA